MPKPEITEQIDGYLFDFTDQHIKIKVNRLNVHKDGRVVGEITIKTDKAGFGPILEPAMQLNFSASRTRKSLVKDLSDKFEGFNWESIIDQLSHHIQELAREGEPVSELWTSEDVPPPEYLLSPILLKGVPTVIFGEKGVNKTTLALAFYVCLILPWKDNPLGLGVPVRSVKTLILDWEAEGSILQYYAKKLQTGMDLPPFPVFYRRCSVPLADDLEQIQKHKSEMKAEVIIIDSVGAAAGGDLKKPEQALAFFSALRRLKVTSLCIAQTSKDEDTKRKRIYGSVYFEYYARSIFELCRSESASEDDYDVALFHRFSNLTKKQKPMGFNFNFNDSGNSLLIERTSVDLGEYREKVATGQRIIEALKSGAKSTEELVDELGIKRNTADQAIRRLRNKELIIKVEDKWGLKAREGLSDGISPKLA